MKHKNEQYRKGKHKTRILIVDDHDIVRRGLMKLINQESDLMVCAAAENPGQALQALEKEQIDLAIVDISLEGMSGLELTERIKLRCPDLIVVILSMYDSMLYAQRSLRAGAAGYVAKHEAAEKIITAIRRALSGKIYVSESRVVKTLSDVPPGINDGPDRHK